MSELHTWVCTKCGRSGLVNGEGLTDSGVEDYAQRTHDSISVNCGYLPFVTPSSPYIRELDDKLTTCQEQKEKLLDLLDDADEQVMGIVNWARAYPLDVFIEPKKEDWKRANEILGQNGISFTALNSAIMRHVIKGVEEYANKAHAALSTNTSQ